MKAVEGAGRRPSPDDKPSRPPPLRMLADRPLGENDYDALRFDAYAAALAELIDHPQTDTPLILAISAPWGAGKTSLAKMLERRLRRVRAARGKPEHVFCWFNAWAHDDAPHLGAAFAADVAKAADRARPWWRRLFSPLPSAMLTPDERLRRRVVLGALALGAAVALALTSPLRELTRAALPLSGGAAELPAILGSFGVGVLAVLIAWSRLFAIAKAAASFVDDPRSEAARGSMEDVSAQLHQLVGQATRARRRLVIFVDDLERCRPPRAVEVCEVASQLLAHRDVVTVLIADMSVIAASAEIKYAKLEGLGALGDGGWGRLYLQKIVQLQFDLPAVRVEDLRAMLRGGQGRDVAAAQASRADSGVEPPPPDPVRTVARVRPRRPGAGFWALMSFCAFGLIVGVVDMDLEVVVVYGAGLLAGAAWSARAAVPRWVDARVVRRALRTTERLIEAKRSRAPSAEALETEVAAALCGDHLELARWLADLERSGEDESRSLTARGVGRLRPRLPRKVSRALDLLRVRIATAELGALGDRAEDLVHELVQRDWTDEEELRRLEVEDSGAFEFLPALPRSAKRTLNHLRVLLRVAHERRMFPAVRLQHISKWVVLSQRWPALATAVGANPSVLGELERARDVESLAEALEPLGLGSLSDADLLRFLRLPDKLTKVAGRLVYLDGQPAPGRTRLA